MSFKARQFAVSAPSRARQVDEKISGNRAIAQQDYAVGECDRFDDVVGDEYGGETLAQPHAFQQLLHLDAGQRVERAERLVEREQTRPADQRARQRDALLLPAGKH